MININLVEKFKKALLLTPFLFMACSELKITSIPNTIQFSNTHSDSNFLCIPAAYTTIDGVIEGKYIINGISHGQKSLKEFVSIHPTKGLLIGNTWYSNNGFQQHILVKNSKSRTFVDQRIARRRCLCSKKGEYFIIESMFPITLTEFAQLVSNHCDNAVNLDMGDYGYGWIGKNKHSRIFKYNKHKQTNWIVC